jgi:hypothetical protein
LVTDGIRTSGRQHPVQHSHADGGLGLLASKAAGSQPRPDQRLVTTHRHFYEGPLAVVGRNFPGRAALMTSVLSCPAAIKQRLTWPPGDAVRQRSIAHMARRRADDSGAPMLVTKRPGYTVGRFSAKASNVSRKAAHPRRRTHLYWARRVRTQPDRRQTHGEATVIALDAFRPDTNEPRAPAL